MGHLTPEQFVDAAERRRAFSHLESCATCRRQVAELGETMLAALDVEAPEPSPLFWAHFSNRVQKAVAAEKIDRDPWWRLRSPGRVAVVAAALAVVVIAAALSLRSPHTPVERRSGAAGTATAANASAETSAAADQEAAFQLIADLSSDLDWDTARAAGLMPDAGWVETVVTELNETERAALERLLHEEIRRSGA